MEGEKDELQRQVEGEANRAEKVEEMFNAIELKMIINKIRFDKGGMWVNLGMLKEFLERTT